MKGTFLWTRMLKGKSLLASAAALLVICLASAGVEASPQAKSQAPSKRAPAATTQRPAPPACCTITAIDEAAGIVTAKVNATGQTFQFTAMYDAFALLGTLRIGQSVYANFPAMEVSLNGASVCCKIVSSASAGAKGKKHCPPFCSGSPPPKFSGEATVQSAVSMPAAGNLGNVANPVGPVDAAKPAAHIIGLNAASRMVTARVDSSGQTFQFQVSNPAWFDSLQIGQGVWANFKTKQISLNGKTQSGTIVSVGPVDGSRPVGPVDASRPVGPVDAAKPVGPVDAVKPSARIIGINATTGIVTARVNSTGQTFQFQVKNSAQLKSLQSGQAVWANFRTQQISLDGRTPTGTIVSVGPVDGLKPIGPVDAARPVGPVDEARPITPTNAGKNSNVRRSTPAGPQGAGDSLNSQGNTMFDRASYASGGLSSNGQASTAPSQSAGLTCSTSPEHMGKLVAQGVMIPSGATIYCRFQLARETFHPGAQEGEVAISTNTPSITNNPPRSVTLTPSLNPLSGPYADFQISTKAISQTVQLRITARYARTSTSTTVTLARAAISYFTCHPGFPWGRWGSCTVPVIQGIVGGNDGDFYFGLTAPADPDGLSIQVKTNYGYSGHVLVPGSSYEDVVVFPAQPVGKETPVSVSLADPLDGSTTTINVILEPPLIGSVAFVANGTAISSIERVPLDGEQLQLFVGGCYGDSPADGTPLSIQYGGTPNLITGPATVAFPQGDIYIPVTVLPCGAPPCQVSVTVGNSAHTSQTATLTVNP